MYIWAVFLESHLRTIFSPPHSLWTECIFLFSGGVWTISIWPHPFRVCIVMAMAMNTSFHCIFPTPKILFVFLFCLMTFVLKKKKKKKSVLAHWQCCLDFFNLTKSYVLEMICIHDGARCSLWCSMCQWTCYCFSDDDYDTTERWIQRQNVMSHKLILNDVLTWLQWFNPKIWTCLFVDFGWPGLIVHCLHQYCKYCIWQHWLCLHTWRYLLLLWLFWVCVGTKPVQDTFLVMHDHKLVANKTEALLHMLIL